ncbi:MAG: SpoIID/LytB domain protein [Pseudonocardiales bacterium]|nr:SpoIID/LytB domain protein [Pseudonocardiales bacterium]
MSLSVSASIRGRSSARRRRSRGLAGGLAIALLAQLLMAIAGTTPAAAAAGDVTLTGHGNGHGRGLSQWGAYGYAVDAGWTYQQILDRYYGGTTLTGDGAGLLTVTLSQPAANATVVRQPAGGLRVAGAPLAPGATTVRVVRTGANAFAIYDGPDCVGPWTLRSSASATEVELTSALSPGEPGNLLQVCEAAGTRSYRGAIVAQQSGTSQATRNRVGIEDYLRGVVPNEMPSGWGAAGGGGGLQALMAQAVAARSYALARAAAPVCDTTTCQVYSGAGTWSGPNYTSAEQAPSDIAIASTAAQVRRLPSGAVASAEFSSSSGGYTAGGAFPAVPDDGDATAANPHHNWAVTLSGTEVSARLGFAGVTSISVTSRTGLGADGGRVVQAEVNHAAGQTTLSGATIASRLGLRSDWFSIAGSTQRGGAGDLSVILATATGSGRVEVHTLTSDSGFSAFSRHTATLLGAVPDPEAWRFMLGGLVSSGSRDLFALHLANTQTGLAELHVLSEASDYQDWVAHIVLPISIQAVDSWQLQLAASVAGSRPDLYLVNTEGTGSGQVEVHALSAASNFQEWFVHSATPLAPTAPDSATYLVADSSGGDLTAILRTATGSGRTELHTLTRGSGYTQFSRHTALPIWQTPGPAFQFSVTGTNGTAADLVMTQLSGTGSGQTEVHILNGATGYSVWTAHAATPLGALESRMATLAVVR